MMSVELSFSRTRNSQSTVIGPALEIASVDEHAPSTPPVKTFGPYRSGVPHTMDPLSVSRKPRPVKSCSHEPVFPRDGTHSPRAVRRAWRNGAATSLRSRAWRPSSTSSNAISRAVESGRANFHREGDLLPALVVNEDLETTVVLRVDNEGLAPRGVLVLLNHGDGH